MLTEQGQDITGAETGYGRVVVAVLPILSMAASSSGSFCGFALTSISRVRDTSLPGGATGWPITSRSRLKPTSSITPDELRAGGNSGIAAGPPALFIGQQRSGGQKVNTFDSAANSMSVTPVAIVRPGGSSSSEIRRVAAQGLQTSSATRPCPPGTSNRSSSHRRWGP